MSWVSPTLNDNLAIKRDQRLEPSALIPPLKQNSIVVPLLEPYHFFVISKEMNRCKGLAFVGSYPKTPRPRSVGASGGL